MTVSLPKRALRSLPRRLAAALAGGPQVMAFLPAITLAAYWLGGEPYLLVTAVVIPALFAAGGLFTLSRAPADPGVDLAHGLPGRTSAAARAETFLQAGSGAAPSVAVLAIGIDDAGEIEDRLGPAAFRKAMGTTADRIVGAVRGSDLLAELAPATWALVLSSPRSEDLELLIQISARLQAAAGEPLPVGGSRIYISASIGIARPGNRLFTSGEALVAAAEHALAEAMAQGPASVRAYAGPAPLPARAAAGLGAEIGEALAAGQIVPWFQPQVRTDTGALAGAEALARWAHPTRGLLLPSEFLPAAEAAGLSERIGATMLHAALGALRKLDDAGLSLPSVSVNFAPIDLRNPAIVDRVRWELDRFGLAPDRLTVEVLETVIEEVGDDMVTRSLAGLAALGCGIDLDDFGTGHAAIGSIRRFSVQRVKIDRSFVRRIDTDTEQQALVSAMILLSDRLGVGTLAEGVETAAEQAALARLGCRHVQGYAIARPMPEDAFRAWLEARRAPAAIPLRSETAGTAPAASATGKTA
jgi:EAL domain-containing protein (putative c-di-GMP-specific phosphodiesterase class I)/GGDEF domain-containing protein